MVAGETLQAIGIVVKPIRAGYARQWLWKSNSAFGAQAGQYTYTVKAPMGQLLMAPVVTQPKNGAGIEASSTTSTGRSSQSSSQQFSGIG